ncbi:MAG: hypothetical protein IKC02_05555 [Oscillospiraceae bacterium]|nr:hypothetical protein [Oscillospiraceae bacterium]
MPRGEKLKKKASCIPGYDYSDAEARQTTAMHLLDKAKRAKTVVEGDWERYNDYYNFIHDVSSELKEYCREKNIFWTPAVCPDPWIAVESQIDPNVPEPEFRGRDSDLDSLKAKKREHAVKYIMEANDLEHKNTANERRLLKLGDAFWKAYWDIERRCGIHEGDISIIDVSPEAIYPDPAVKSGDIQDCQYLAYVYSVHKVRFRQLYGKVLEEKDVDIEELLSGSYVSESSIFDLSTSIDDREDTVQIMEFWFRWPEDAEVETPFGKVKVEVGDIGCSVQAGGVEVKLIAKYWEKTGRQCKLFPFVHYWRIKDENSFWNKSELFPIMDLVDAQDRKLASALLNDALLSNDTLIMEEDSLAEGETLSNEPGAVVVARKNKGATIRRMGGLQSGANATLLLNYLKEQIERASRNYETNMGKETTRQTTAAGLAMLREDANEQESIKASDRRSGFERLYRLLDWLALEFFDDDRLIYLGADKNKNRENPVSMNYNSSEFAETMSEVYDANGAMVREAWDYFPTVDVSLNAGDSVVKGKQATLQALSTLCQADITPDNWQLYAAQLEILDLPDKDRIIAFWRQRFESAPTGLEGGTGYEMPYM